MPMYEGEVVLHASPYNYVLSKLDSIYNTLSCGLYDKVCLNGVTDHKNSLVLTQSRIITVKAVRHTLAYFVISIKSVLVSVAQQQSGWLQVLCATAAAAAMWAVYLQHASISSDTVAVTPVHSVYHYCHKSAIQHHDVT
jgi:hypothetical protein